MVAQILGLRFNTTSSGRELISISNCYNMVTANLNMTSSGCEINLVTILQRERIPDFITRKMSYNCARFKLSQYWFANAIALELHMTSSGYEMFTEAYLMKLIVVYWWKYNPLDLTCIAILLFVTNCMIDKPKDTTEIIFNCVLGLYYIIMQNTLWLFCQVCLVYLYILNVSPIYQSDVYTRINSFTDTDYG